MAGDIPAAVRKLVHSRDNDTCRWCGRTNAGIHLHHIDYRSSGGQHTLNNLISLCPQHHGQVHSNKSFYQPVLEELIDADVNLTGLALLRSQKPANVEVGSTLTSLRQDQPSRITRLLRTEPERGGYVGEQSYSRGYPQARPACPSPIGDTALSTPPATAIDAA